MAQERVALCHHERHYVDGMPQGPTPPVVGDDEVLRGRWDDWRVQSLSYGPSVGAYRGTVSVYQQI